jgi:hypothetical protein
MIFSLRSGLYGLLGLAALGLSIQPEQGCEGVAPRSAPLVFRLVGGQGPKLCVFIGKTALGDMSRAVADRVRWGKRGSRQAYTSQRTPEESATGRELQPKDATIPAVPSDLSSHRGRTGWKGPIETWYWLFGNPRRIAPDFFFGDDPLVMAFLFVAQGFTRPWSH